MAVFKSVKGEEVPPEWVYLIRRQGTGAPDENGEIIKRGAEIVDPRPVAIPAGFKRPETLAEQVRRLVRAERDEDPGEETWDDANDLNIPDDFDPSSPWETIYDETLGREVTPEEYHKNLPQMKAELEQRLRNHYRAMAKAEAEEKLWRKMEQREAAEEAAPSSSAPKAALAEPQKS